MHEIPYYRLEKGRSISRGFDWLAHITIKRNDTDEDVVHLSERGQTIQEAEGKLNDSAKRRLETLAKPVDWGRDPTVPRFIQEYLRAKEAVISRAWRAKRASESQEEWSAACNTKYEELSAALKADFKLRVEEFTEEQLTDLATPTVRELSEPIDAWVLDEKSARCTLFELIENPSSDLVTLFRKMQMQYDESLPDETNSSGSQ